LAEQKNTQTQETGGYLTCKVCGKRTYKTAKTEQGRLDKVMCSSCFGELQYQQERVTAVVARLQDVFVKITFDEVRLSLVEQVATILKSNRKK